MDISPDALSCVCGGLDINDLGRLSCVARAYDAVTRPAQEAWLERLTPHVVAARRLVGIGIVSPDVVDTAFTTGGWLWQGRWELDLGGALMGDDAPSIARDMLRRARAAGCARRRVATADGVRVALLEADAERRRHAVRIRHPLPPRTPQAERARAHHRLQIWCEIELAVHEMLECPRSIERASRACVAVHNAISCKLVDGIDAYETEMYTRYLPEVMRTCPADARRTLNTAFKYLDRYYVPRHNLTPISKMKFN